MALFLQIVFLFLALFLQIFFPFSFTFKNSYYVYVGMLVDVPEDSEVLFFFCFFISVPQIVYNFS